MTTMPRNTNPKPAKTRCSMDHWLTQLVNLSAFFPKTRTQGGAGGGGMGSGRDGAVGGFVVGRSRVADSMTIVACNA